MRQVCISAFAAIQLVVLLLWATHAASGSSASVAAASLDFAAAGVLFVLSTYEHDRSVAPSTIIGLYLLVTLPFDIARLRTLFLLKSETARTIASIVALSTCVKVVTLVAEVVEKRKILLSQYQHLGPEETSGIYNKSIFWWINPLLRTGFSNVLRVSDLYRLDPTLSSADVERRFTARWKSQPKSGRFALLRTITSVLKWQFLLSALPRLLIIGLKYVQPFLIQRTITYVSDRHNQPANIGWGLTAAYALTYLGMALLSASYHHLLNRCITQVRGGLVSLIYNKTLDVSITSVDPAASLTLMSADVLRITQSLEWFNDAWGAFFELVVAVGLLAQLLGLLTIGPALVFLFSIAGTFAVTAVIPRFQKLWIDAIQRRVSYTSGILGSMRPIKLLGLSEIIKTLTQGLRTDEIHQASKFRWLFVVRLIFQNAGNIFGPFVALSMLVLRANQANKPLDLALGFSILSLVQLVDSPLGIMSFSLPMLVSSIACVDRIQQYLLSNSRQDNRLLLNPGHGQKPSITVLPSKSMNDTFEMQTLRSRSPSEASEAIVMRDCSLGWEEGLSLIKDVNLSIKFGDVVMVVGPVGCGKSTLLKGLLGETASSSGFVYVSNVTFAFADQEAWIQNVTIRDAVSGTSNVIANESWYHEVLDCCGLSEDVSNLPQRDRTIIGSKGISLSGGQKQR